MKLFTLLSRFIVILLLIGPLTVRAQQLPVQNQARIWLQGQNLPLDSGRLADSRQNGYFLSMDTARISPSSFHYRQAFSVDSNASAQALNYLPGNEYSYTLYSVYAPADSMESHVWTIILDSNNYYRLTSTSLTTTFRDTTYTSAQKTGPVINKTRLNWKSRSIDSSIAGIYLLGIDSLAFRGRFAEFLLFDRPLSRPENMKIHTYLALKYGISLVDMNYINSHNRLLWNWEKNKAYARGIAGIGRDDSLNLYQLQGCGKAGEGEVILSIGEPTTYHHQHTQHLPDRHYILWGHTRQPLAPNPDTSQADLPNYLSQRTWKIQPRGDSASQLATRLVFKGHQFDTTGQAKLIICRSNAGFHKDSIITLIADSIDQDNRYYFHNIQWDPDSSGADYFTFQAPDTSGHSEYFNQKVQHSGETDYHFACKALPNPARQTFKLFYSCSTLSDVRIDIYNSYGQHLRHLEVPERRWFKKPFSFEHSGVYLLKVQNQKQTQTLKVIVK
jgi:hypothetical protein